MPKSIKMKDAVVTVTPAVVIERVTGDELLLTDAEAVCRRDEASETCEVLKPQADLYGAPLQASVTVPVNPFRADSEMLPVPVWPLVTVMLDGSESEKSAGGAISCEAAPCEP